MSEFLVYNTLLLRILLSLSIDTYMDNASIKDNIRKIRKSKRLTQEEMAHKLGISLTAYRDLERGDTSIVNTNLLKVADELEISSEELLLGYQPVQMEGPVLEDVRQEYGSRINILERRISDLEKLVFSLEETISTKNEIIAMLRKSLAEDK